MAKQYKELIRYLAFLVAVFFGTINSGGAMPDGDRYIFHVGQQYNSLVCFDIGYISQWRGLYGSDAVELLNQVYAQNNARCAEAFRSAPQQHNLHSGSEGIAPHFGTRQLHDQLR